MTLAQALNAIAANLIPLLNSLSANPASQSQADATALTRVINTLLTDAMQANALDLEQKVAAAGTASQRLSDFTAQADAKSKQLATQQSNVSKFVSLATDVGNVLVAGAAGNVVGIGNALAATCSDLGIATV